MADNYQVNGVTEAGGETFAGDDDGVAKHPYVKVEYGANNTQTPVDATNPMPIIPTAGAVDAITGAQKTITYPHHEIHDKCSFICWHTVTSLGDGGTVIIAFKTMAGTKRVHLEGVFSTLTGGHLAIWEGATWNQGSGIALPIINRFREPSPTSSILLENRGQVTPTASDEMMGTVTGLATGSVLLANPYVFGDIGGGNNPGSGGSGSSRGEFVLEPDQTYAIVFTATAASNGGQIRLEWYEHEDVA
jgi:hypothetical protein